MAAAFVAALAAAEATSTTNNTTIAYTTNRAIAAGDTAFFYLSCRGGSAGNTVSTTVTNAPGDATIEVLHRDRSGSPAVAILRMYCPTGLASGTTLTFTWASAGSRKVCHGSEWSGVANANAEATSGLDNTGSTPTCGTTGATTTTTGVHVAAWCWNSSSSTNSGTAGNDEEGAMTERADKLVGASQFSYLYAETRPVAAAHAGGMTAAVTVSGTLASWAGVQGIWAGAATLVSGSGSGTSATSGSASGTVTHHMYQGTASGTSGSSGSASGHQLYKGTATGSSATGGAATGTASPGVVFGTATGRSATGGAAYRFRSEIAGFLFRTVHDDGSFEEPNGFTDSQDGARYGVIYTNWRDRSHVAALKTQNPRLKVYCYFDCTYTDSTDDAGDNSGVGYTDASTNHPTWFLLDSGSDRIAHTGSATAWLMDVGLEAYQDACVTNILAHMDDDGAPWDGVFLDEVDVRSDWTAAATPALYPTEADWQAAYESFLANVAAQIHDAGYALIINLGDDYNSTPSYAVSERWLDYIDGHLQESWTDGGAGLAQQLAWTPERITIVKYAETTGKVSLLHSHNTTEAGQTYALALDLILSDGHTFLDVAWPTYQDEQILPEFDQAARLGPPTGPYTNPEAGVYRRNYRYGVVVANTTNATSSSISLGGTFSGSGLTQVSSVAVPALTGYVLIEPNVGAAAATSATSGSASGSATHHSYSGTAVGTSGTSGSAVGTASSPPVLGTAAGTSATSGAATGSATNHLVSGTAAGTSASSGAATGSATHHLYQGSASGSSSTSATATGRVTRFGVGAGSSSTTGAAAGSATHHVYQGTAAGSSSTSGAASGSATPHLYQGTAAGTSSSSGVATGRATLFGAGTGRSSTSGAAAGSATHHVYQGTAAGASSTTGSASGHLTIYGVATGRSATSGLANVGAFGLGRSATSGSATGSATPHDYQGSASGSSSTSGAASGSATHHNYAGVATGRSSTTGAASGTATHHVYQGVASSTSTTSASAIGTATHHVYQGVATGRSPSSALAIGSAAPHLYQGSAFGVSATSGSALGMIPQHGLPVRFRSTTTQATRYATGHRATIYATGESAGGGIRSGIRPTDL